jgi:hypothetical protein
MRENVDLCENGVVFARWTYWPWRSVELIRWGPGWAPKLVLGRGSRRIAADVQLSQRDAVEAILAGKLPTEQDVE